MFSFALLTKDDRLLFYTYLHCPHEDYFFNVDDWAIEPVEQANGFINHKIMIIDRHTYLSLIYQSGIFACSSSRWERDWQDAVRLGEYLLDRGPVALKVILSSMIKPQKSKVNWERDGF